MLLFPVLAGITWLAAHQLSYFDETTAFALWPEDSLRIGFASVMLAPIVAALLAWDAGRDQRRRIGDLLATTPQPPFARDLTRWAGTVAWALLAYGLVAAVMLIQTAQAATWGGPIIPALVMGFVLIPTGGAVGYLAGNVLPSRFVPPLVAIVIYVAEAGIAALGSGDPFSELKYLSPFAMFLDNGGSQAGIFRELTPNLFGEATVWLIAVGALSLSIVALRRHRGKAAMAAVLVSVILAVLAARPLIATSPDPRSMGTAIRYDPICSEGAIPVCVHPAYAARLAGYQALIDTLVAPLVGVPGVPTAAHQTGFGDWRLQADGTLPFHVFPNGVDAFTAARISEDIVNDWTREVGPCEGPIDDAQYAVSWALMARGGWPPPEEGRYYYANCASVTTATGSSEAPTTREDILAAAKRFAALSIDEQRAWFAEQYRALRAGALTLDDLP